MTKQRHYFYTMFRNVPYTDQEWEQENTYRANLAKNHPTYCETSPHRCCPLDARPCHSFKYGPTYFSHKEARKACEEALENLKAQRVSYTVWSSARMLEEWFLEKNGHWTKAHPNIL